MKTYLFYTSDGYTYDNLHNRASNMQVLGHGEGIKIDEAFAHFKQNQSYLSKQAFNNIMAIQTLGDAILDLKIKE